jgi:hypothetical protein
MRIFQETALAVTLLLCVNDLRLDLCNIQLVWFQRKSMRLYFELALTPRPAFIPNSVWNSQIDLYYNYSWKMTEKIRIGRQATRVPVTIAAFYKTGITSFQALFFVCKPYTITSLSARLVLFVLIMFIIFGAANPGDRRTNMIRLGSNSGLFSTFLACVFPEYYRTAKDCREKRPRLANKMDLLYYKV